MPAYAGMTRNVAGSNVYAKKMPQFAAFFVAINVVDPIGSSSLQNDKETRSLNS